MRLGSALIVLLGGVAPSMLRAQEPEKPISVLDSVFTAEQADRGEQTFMTMCLDCHLPEEFSDAGYLSSWEGQTVTDFVEFVQSSMPEDNPGSLKEVEYLDIMTYILKLNGIPAGNRNLDLDLAKRARIELP